MTAVQAYKYLFSRADREPGDVVEGAFALAELLKMVIVRDTFERVYHVFKQWPAAWALIESRPPERRCFEQVILGETPQRIKFDIDIKDADVDAVLANGAAIKWLELPTDSGEPLDDELLGIFFEELGPPLSDLDWRRRAVVDAFMRKFHAAVLDEFHLVYFETERVGATLESLGVYDSSGETADGYKFSFHGLLLNWLVANHREAKGFSQRVIERRIHPAFRHWIDPSVNASTQNFRLAGNTKPGAGRPKLLTSRYGTAREDPDRGVVTGVSARVLAPVFDVDPVRPEGLVDQVLPDGDIHTVLEALAVNTGLLSIHKFDAVRGGVLLFHRTAPGHCELCGRTHENENSLMLRVEKVEVGDQNEPPHRVIEYCRRNPGVSRVVCVVKLSGCMLGVDRERAREFKAQRAQVKTRGVSERVAALGAGQVDPGAAFASRLDRAENRHVYSEPYMREFELDARTLIVRGPMGTGKTKNLRSYINRLFPPGNGLRTPVIRWVTFRKTFSGSIHRGEFSDFELYSQIKGAIDAARHPRIIVQVESGHRLDLGGAPEPVDCLIVDESASVLEQFNSPNHREFATSFAIFLWMVSTARRVIFMDANAGDCELRLLETARAAHPPLLHWNQHLRAKELGHRYRVTNDQGLWLDRLFNALDHGQRIVVPSNSKAEADALAKEIKDRYPELTVGLYTSDTAVAEKELHFGDVALYWGQLDVLIYTPTVSAGISFELEHFDALYGHFTDNSCTVEVCSQMLARVRDIRLREYNLCLIGSGNTLPTEIAEIDAAVRARRANFEENAERAFDYQLDRQGRPVIHEGPFYPLWLELTRIRNLSKNGFSGRFIDLIASTGASVEMLEPLEGAEERVETYTAIHKTAKAELQRSAATAIALARPIGSEEAADIQDRLRRAADDPTAVVSVEERNSYNLTRFCDDYRWHGRTVSPEMVLTYGPHGIRRIYAQLCTITGTATIDEALATMHRRQLDLENLQTAACGWWGSDARFAPGFLARATPALRADSRALYARTPAAVHSIAVELMRACGFCCVTDRGLIRTESVCARLCGSRERIVRLLPIIAAVFECRVPAASTVIGAPEPVYIKTVLGVINLVLRQTYGIEVRRSAKSVGGLDFYIAVTPVGALFPISSEPDDDDRPGGPRPHVHSALAPCKINWPLLNFVESIFYDRRWGGPHDLPE